MIEAQAMEIIDGLRRGGMALDPGLSEREVERVEEWLGCALPPDLSTFLRAALPIGPRFPDWRRLSDELRQQLAWPLDGLCFDIEHNAFWWKDWGSRPNDLSAAFAVATEKVASAPTLIPVFGHRYLPADPCLAGNPVFSVYQTDIIYYGNDLASYLAAEFSLPMPRWAAASPRPIRFWSELVS